VPSVEERLMTSIEAELASSVGTAAPDAGAENEVTA
jgi:hypothetical protein